MDGGGGFDGARNVKRAKGVGVFDTGLMGMEMDEFDLPSANVTCRRMRNLGWRVRVRKKPCKSLVRVRCCIRKYCFVS
jgi:hypothetical protein